MTLGQSVGTLVTTMKKMAVVQIRVTEEEKAEWAAVAKAEGVGVSAWIRNTLAWTMAGPHPMEMILSVPQVRRAMEAGDRAQDVGPRDEGSIRG